MLHAVGFGDVFIYHGGIDETLFSLPVLRDLPKCVDYMKSCIFG